MKKVCRGTPQSPGCGRSLSTKRFYRHPATGDGFTSKCKNCLRKKQRARDRARRRLAVQAGAKEEHREEHQQPTKDSMKRLNTTSGAG
jgi:hypothetical protein